MKDQVLNDFISKLLSEDIVDKKCLLLVTKRTEIH